MKHCKCCKFNIYKVAGIPKLDVKNKEDFIKKAKAAMDKAIRDLMKRKWK